MLSAEMTCQVVGEYDPAFQAHKYRSSSILGHHWL
jgi:hypothetical protein